jgi:hypothetical protein
MEYTSTALAVNQTLGICTTIVTVIGAIIFIIHKYREKKMEQKNQLEPISNKVNTELIIDEKEKRKLRLSTPNGFGYVEFYADAENIDLLIEQLEAHQKTILKLRK